VNNVNAFANPNIRSLSRSKRAKRQRLKRISGNQGGDRKALPKRLFSSAI